MAIIDSLKNKLGEILYPRTKIEAVDGLSEKLGTTDISSIGDGSVTGAIDAVSDEVDAVEEQLKKKVLPQCVSASFNAKGWHRIAKIVGSLTQVLGAAQTGLDVQVMRSYSSAKPEIHRISVLTSYTNGVKFANELSISEVFLFTKIRYTVDESATTGYIEIYYDSDAQNYAQILISNTATSASSNAWWNVMSVEATEETVDGVTVLGTHEFSANKSYESEIAAIRSAQAIPSGITTIKALADATTIDTSYFVDRSDTLTDYPEALKNLGATLYVRISIKVDGAIRYIEMLAVSPSTISYTMHGYTATAINNLVWGRGYTNLNAAIDAINNRLAYKAIAGFINPGDTGCTASAYTENGLVHVYLTVPQGASGLISVSISNEAYYPRSPVGGTFASLSSSQDAGKLSGYATNVGKISIYASSALTATEALTFVYPLKSS